MTPKAVLNSLIAKNVLPSTLAYHWETLLPNRTQLRRADDFFLSYRPLLLYSAKKFRTVQQSTVPEVAFLGRSNVGKSSIINGIMRSTMCHTSREPGRTTSMNFIAVGGPDGRGNAGRMMVLDMPGYGKGSRKEWGEEIMKYLVGRRQLRRAFVLIDASHGVKNSDQRLLQLLRKNAVSHQVILAKVDRILLPKTRTISEESLQRNIAKLRRICEDVRTMIQPGRLDGPEALGEIISCSADKRLDKERKFGLDQVRWAVLEAAGLGVKRRLSPLEVVGQGHEEVEPILEPAAVDETRINWRTAVVEGSSGN